MDYNKIIDLFIYSILINLMFLFIIFDPFLFYLYIDLILDHTMIFFFWEIKSMKACLFPDAKLYV